MPAFLSYLGAVCEVCALDGSAEVEARGRCSICGTSLADDAPQDDGRDEPVADAEFGAEAR